jgi:RNA polymerase-binding transcription factor DksA
VFPTGTDDVDLGLLEELATGLAAVQGSLDRLDAGTYGICEQCGQPLDDGLLEGSPTATVCGRHTTSSPDPTSDDRGTIEL